MIAGFPVSFVLLSWLNALYSFDYKWSLSRHKLEERVKFFEQHWAFFAGRLPFSVSLLLQSHFGSVLNQTDGNIKLLILPLTESQLKSHLLDA